ncbi:MAG: triose-phosphate isomerase [Rhodospirillales bacterium]|nr:triose-phosphate isomerase [Rhodospirillales bacterium]
MNKLLGEAAAYCQALTAHLASEPFPGHVFVVPPFTALSTVCRETSKSPVRVGAQDAHWEEAGAFTGEISCPMIADCGAELVEMGHSERRQYFGETDTTVNLKAKAAIRNGLRPLICIGEDADERSSGRAKDVIERQVTSALDGIEAGAAGRIIFAYEPVWAIGEGAQSASPEIANGIAGHVRKLLRIHLGPEWGETVPVLYGGSVNAGNAAGYLLQPEVDGLFIGRAAWKVEGFIEILGLTRDALASAGQLSRGTGS